MFIGVLGSVCVGKTTVIEYLTSKGFVELVISPSFRELTAKHLRVFESTGSLLDFVTRNWRTNYVAMFNDDDLALLEFSVRPFFLVLKVDAPILQRWRRLQRKRPNEAQSLESFIEANDSTNNGDHKVPVVEGTTQVTLINDVPTKEALFAKIELLDLLNPERLRPGWDNYFMTLANLASSRSNCMKRRVGAIIVRNRRIIATGYNGTPRNMTNCNEGGCPRCNGGADVVSGDECLCLHAEENVLLEAGRERVGNDATLYCNTCPCLRCSIKIVQTGIGEVVYSRGYKMDDATARVFVEAGVTLRQYSPPV